MRGSGAFQRHATPNQRSYARGPQAVPYKDPEKRRANARAYAHNNPEKVRVWGHKSRAKNIDRIREHDKIRGTTPERQAQARAKSLKYWNGLSAAKKQEPNLRKLRRHEILAGRSRPLVCDICGEPPGPGKALHFDHCHQKGYFRGWLCNLCNCALGFARDDPNILRKLLAYLERNKVNHSPQLVLPGV